jgi:hypothetical protein
VGLHFGFPFCHAGTVADPEFGEERSCDEFTPPEMKLGAHVAALGMKFYMGSMFPSEYHGRIFIAQHGSWNRSEKVGYRVVAVDPVSGEQTVFAEGWLEDENAWGRPVDVLVMPDGALLVSDDMAGAIYRIEYTPVTNTGSVLKNSSERRCGTMRSATDHNFITISGKRVLPEHFSVPAYLIEQASGKGCLSVSRHTNLTGEVK